MWSFYVRKDRFSFIKVGRVGVLRKLTDAWHRTWSGTWWLSHTHSFVHSQLLVQIKTTLLASLHLKSLTSAFVLYVCPVKWIHRFYLVLLKLTLTKWTSG